LENQQDLFAKSFLEDTSIKEASADKMMTPTRGGVWHKKDKDKGVVPNGLTGLDKQATWSYSKADGWVYGHGSLALVSHQTAVLLQFKWMPNSASEAKRMEMEITRFAGLIETVCMDSKADDEKMFTRLKTENAIKLLSVPRSKMDKSEARKQMIAEQMREENRLIYKQRSTTVEPMQGLVKELFELERCWMRGDESNRWLFAAMGIAVQIAQRLAHLNGASTWKIKNEVLGL
jgi:hypothetical protein